MPEPITTGTVLTFLGSAVVSGVLGNRSDAGFKSRWEKFRNNLKQYRPDANHELAAASYRSYLQATLQSCVLLLERQGMKVDGWFKSGVLPETIANGIRSFLNKAPAGVFTQGNKDWLEAVSVDHFRKLKLLERSQLDIPAEYEHQEFATLLAEIEVLMQPEEAREREQLIREALPTRVLNDLERQFGEAPAAFKELVHERWFEFLCAGFQYHIKHQQEIANAFESRLIAKLVARSEWQQQLVQFAGESLNRIEAALREQSEAIERVRDVVREEGEKTRLHIEQQLGTAKTGISEPEPLIHTLPIQLEIEGRQEECTTILHAMSESKQRVVAFAAPGGFGKTALLAKVVQQLSPNGAPFQTNIDKLLHVDCRHDIKLTALFAHAGRLIGQEQAFQDIYNSDASLPDKLQEIFSRLSTDPQKRCWFVFDNLEPLLNTQGEIADAALADFFSAIFAGGHSVYALVSAREVPKFSPREQILELTEVGGNLFEGLPLDDCVAYLKKNGAATGLDSDEEINSVLKEFARRVHQIPLALVWAIGYLRQTNFTLKAVLERKDLFDDFDQEQTKDAQRYENKGLKRLHYEQLKIQTGESLPILQLLAFFKRPVPKGALAHLLDEIELNKVLTRLERNNLMTRKESPEAQTLYSGDDLAINLYSLHPVICENEFFSTLPNKERPYEKAATQCWERASLAYHSNCFAYAVKLSDCAERLFEYLTKELGRVDLLNSVAGMLMNKGEALRSLAKLPEAVVELDKAIMIFERLVNEEQQSHLATNLAMTYMNKGVALNSLTKLSTAITEFDKAIVILDKLVHKHDRSDLANNLAMVYMNKGGTLYILGKLPEAVEESDKAIDTFNPLFNNGQSYVGKGLAKSHMNKGAALHGLTQCARAIAEYDKAIAILERLDKEQHQIHIESDLALVYMNKGGALYTLGKLLEAVEEHDKAITIYERLVNNEKQSHLAHQLATSYMNKALALAQRDVSAAFSCYEQSLNALTCCIAQLNMFWIMPEMLQTLRYRLLILLDSERWELAAKDILRFFSLYEPYIERDDIDDDLKEAADKEVAYMIIKLRQVPLKHLKILDRYLGDSAVLVRFLVSGAEGA